LYHQYHCVLSKPCHSMLTELVSPIIYEYYLILWSHSVLKHL